MITVTKLNDREMVINSELIETIEKTPDTTITMTTGKKFLVKEPVEDIIERAVAYKLRINQYIK